MNIIQRVKSLLSEMPNFPIAKVSPVAPQSFSVDYYAQTPKGSRSRFQRNSTLWHVRGAASETAILEYLRTIHPGCEITIQRISFK